MSEGTPSVALELLQGKWVASRGEGIQLRGTELFINGSPVAGGVKVGADKQQVVGYGIYEFTSITIKGSVTEVLWNAGPQEIIWRRAEENELDTRRKQMDSAIGSQSDSLAAASYGGRSAELAAIQRLNDLIEQWREGPLERVKSSDICPDWTNRAETGLSVEHVHYIATMIMQNGFKSRRRGLRSQDGAHDVPVLIRQSASSKLGQDTLQKWRTATHETPGFPKFLLDQKSVFYCSLGNGHFSQALNCFRVGTRNLWTGAPYNVGNDDALREAIEDGVDSLVLSERMPWADRKFVSEMLNKSHGRPMMVEENGHVRIDMEGPVADARMFVGLSKVLDAEELSCLVRQKLGVDVDGQVSDPELFSEQVFSADGDTLANDSIVEDKEGRRSRI